MIPTMSPSKIPGMTAREFRELLQAARITQTEAARIIGYSRPMVNQYAGGSKPIPPALAALIRERIIPVIPPQNTEENQD